MQTQWPGSTPEERGKMAEEKFFEAWANKLLFPKWMVSVERPTLHEDVCQKTDAVIVRIHGSNHRIQIKSYFLSKNEYLSLMQYGVIPISIQATDSLWEIRRKTIRALKRFENFTNNSQPVFAAIKRSTFFFYKKGKKIFRNQPQKNH